MTKYFCCKCDALLFDNGDDDGHGLYTDLCLKCKYGKKELEK